MSTLRTLAAAALLSAPLAAGDAFQTTTPGKPGSGGVVPVLAGSGPGTPGSTTNALLLSDALAGSTATAIVGFSELAAPFRGGVLGPAPDFLLHGLPVDGAGALSVPVALPADMPPGVGIWTQFWIDDPGAFGGRSASNTAKLTLQPQPPASGLFPGQPVIVSHNTRSGIALGDLDDDGVLDVVLAAHDFAFDGGEFVPVGGALSVLLGLGSGDFGAETLHAAGEAPNDVEIADLDGDGTLDLVASNAGANTVSVLLGEGGGEFAAAQQFPAGVRPADLAVADLDADGALDLVVVNPSSFQVSRLLGAGDGTFAAPQSGFVGFTPRALSLADLDEDGVVDLLVATDQSSGPFNDGLVVQLGQGDGSFGPNVKYAQGTAFTELTVGDLDADGHVDVITRSLIFRGLGDGTLAAPQAYAGGGAALTTGDLDHDSVLDIVSGVGGLSLLPGQGDGSVGPAETFSVVAGTAAIALGDLDGDGVLDAAVASNSGGALGPAFGYLTALIGDTQNVVHASQSYPGGLGTRALVAADLDQDGATDLALASALSGAVSILRGLGDGSFAAATDFPAGDGASALAAADLDQDGVLDLVVATPELHAVAVLGGSGDGGFGAPQTLAVGQLPQAVGVADLDGDGLLDIVSTNSGSGDVSVLRGLPAGAFAAAQSFPAGAAPTSLAVGDLDRDGDLDLAVVNRDTDTLSLLFGSGDGSFGPPVAHDVGDAPVAVRIADLDADARPDLVVGNSISDDVSVLLATGAGSFAAAVSYAVSPEPGACVVADIDGDGVLDVAALHADGFDVLRGHGDGTLGVAAGYALGAPDDAFATDITAVDADGDGALDIACTTTSGLLGTGFDGVTVMPNQH